MRAYRKGQSAWLLGLTLPGLTLAACRAQRHEEEPRTPVYADVAPLLDKACAACHGEQRSEAGYSVADYLASVGCTADGGPATLPADATAKLVAVLQRDDHYGLVTTRERELLLSWVSAGAPAARNVLHGKGVLDPRSAGWHGKLAAANGYAALRDADGASTCGRCHAGAPVQPQGKTGATDGATPCTSCHGEPAGVLACSTCHGKNGRSYPPRDVCYFGGAARDPHAAHVEPSPVRATGFGCDTCHPVPEKTVFGAGHADGKVDLRFSSPMLDSSAHFNADDKSCSVACHTRSGMRNQPDWKVAAPLDCQSCHLSPPPAHPPGACNSCHADMGSSADSLQKLPLHINGKVDVGDGRGSCGSCHGSDDTGAPGDVNHRQHLTTQLTLDIHCDSCHTTPLLADLHSPASHMNGKVDVSLTGRAARPERPARYDGAQRTCANASCHGDQNAPRWGSPPQPGNTCNTCHATPPPPPHSSLPGCGGGLCHGGEVAPTGSGFRITESGRALHIDGRVQAGP